MNTIHRHENTTKVSRVLARPYEVHGAGDMVIFAKKRFPFVSHHSSLRSLGV